MTRRGVSSLSHLQCRVNREGVAIEVNLNLPAPYQMNKLTMLEFSVSDSPTSLVLAYNRHPTDTKNFFDHLSALAKYLNPTL